MYVMHGMFNRACASGRLERAWDNGRGSSEVDEVDELGELDGCRHPEPSVHSLGHDLGIYAVIQEAMLTSHPRAVGNPNNSSLIVSGGRLTV